MSKTPELTRQLLVTVGANPSALYGARFVGGFFGDKSNLGVDLFYTADNPEQSGRDAAELSKTKGEASLTAAKTLLLDLGFPSENIGQKLKVRTKSTVDDIIYEADKGLYDALVIGRRGVNLFDDVMGAGIGAGVLEKRVHFPLWFCRMPEVRNRNVLAPVDGSDPSLRVLDHVGFMLSGEPGHEITLLRIERKGAAARMDPEEIFSLSKSVLVENGVDPNRIHERIVRSDNPAKAVLERAESDRFAVVAAGRTGQGKSFLKHFFFGSVTKTLFFELTGSVLWLSH